MSFFEQDVHNETHTVAEVKTRVFKLYVFDSMGKPNRLFLFK